MRRTGDYQEAVLIKKLNAAFEAARNTWAVWLFRPAAESGKGLEMRSNNIFAVVAANAEFG